MDKELKDMIKPIPNIINVDDIQEIIDTNKYYYKTLEKIQKIVDNEKITGIEARLMIKDVLEGK